MSGSVPIINSLSLADYLLPDICSHTWHDSFSGVLSALSRPFFSLLSCSLLRSCEFRITDFSELDNNSYKEHRNE